MNVAIVTRPTMEPVSVAEVKEHLYIDVSDYDSMIAGIISAARAKMENWTRRAILTQTWDYFLGAFPCENYIVLPFGNLQSVTSVKYKDVYGTESTMTITTDYLVETNGEGHGRIVLPYGGVWPSGDFYPSNPISIRFVCGWTSAALVPWTIKHGIKLICAEMYEARGEPVVGQTVEYSKAAENLIVSDRLWGELLRIGPLDKRIAIEQVTETRDASGGVIETWSTFADVSASISPLIGREYIASKQIDADLTHRIRIRYIEGLTPKMRISWNDRLFDITSIINVDERNREIVIMATEDV